jgi:hypothetical protein
MFMVNYTPNRLVNVLQGASERRASLRRVEWFVLWRTHRNRMLKRRVGKQILIKWREIGLSRTPSIGRYVRMKNQSYLQ